MHTQFLNYRWDVASVDDGAAIRWRDEEAGQSFELIVTAHSLSEMAASMVQAMDEIQRESFEGLLEIGPEPEETSGESGS